jgi:YD repeat-containing protein
MEWIPDWSLAAPYEFIFVSIPDNRQLQLQTGGEPGDRYYVVGWRPDGSEVLFLRMRGDHKRLDLMAADPTTGNVRSVITESEETFIKGIATDPHWNESCWPLDDRGHLIWMSERDGWNHLYLYDLNGNLLRQLTDGEFAVIGIVAVDERNGWIYFTGQGEAHRPYDIHLYRVNLQGEGLAQLTEPTGAHDIQFSPSLEYFIDTHSSVDRPPSSDLRTADGTLLQTLSVASIERLEELAWVPPEEFVVKAQDGITDLHGVLLKPYDFDPEKSYPVVEYVYAGPQGVVHPRSFLPADWQPFQALAQLGFIVFAVDGRGTPGRGKAFQDVVYGNFARGEIPEHVAVLRQLGQERPYMDLTRVGVWGWSWGGYFTVRALLTAPDVYHVGVALAASVGEYGYPNDIYQGPLRDTTEFDYASNSRLASGLEGKLLLIYGTNDIHVEFAAGMIMVDALIEASVPFDLLVFPERDHFLPLQRGYASDYFWEATRRYFQKHLEP